LPFKRKNDIASLLKKQNLQIYKIVEVKQTENHNPFRIIFSGSNIPGDVESTSIDIKNGDDYSTTFKELLRDYYLYL
jgi:tRNA1(Val) A37 N6-methylase TrmN6